jgi:hypothetical protein
MRMLIALCALPMIGCGKENAGAEAAREEAEAALKQKMDKGEVPKTIKPPVAGETKLDCTKLIDPAVYTTALGEKEPLTVSDVTKTDKEATATCNLIRGGKKLSAAEQAALTKKEGKLGVLPGDPLCQVRLSCSTIEDPDKYRKKCEEQAAIDLKRSSSPFNGVRGDETMGNFACVQVVPTGAFDAQVFRFFDADTKCIFEVRGGPSNQDNDMTRNCAKTARDTIGPAQLKT